jgi:hypothetical protein
MSEITVEDHERMQRAATLAVVEYATCAGAVMGYLEELGKGGTPIHPGMMIETTRAVVELYCAEKTRLRHVAKTPAEVAKAMMAFSPESQR